MAFGPGWPKPDVWLTQLSTDGPMARTVRDLGALLQVQSGSDARVPFSLPGPVPDFMPPAQSSVRGLRIGWLGDLGGHLAVEDGILDVCEEALARFESGGAVIEPLSLGFSAPLLWDSWLVWRRALTSATITLALAQPGATREQIKPEALWEFDQAQGLSFADLMRASQVRTQYFQHLLGLFERFDLLALPAAQVWPFVLSKTWPKRIGDRAMDTYHRWMECMLYATFADLPAISVPAGFDWSGRLPMGLQLIGRPQADAEVLRAAAGYEEISADLLARRPPAPST
ncbi:MAG: hypothetical protein NVS2B4_21050 [Ramlibacter sp.]